MDRVRADKAITPNELYANSYEVVDVFKIIADSLLGDVGITITNNQVPACTLANLVCEMRGEDVLTIIPSNINLLED